MCVYKLLMLKLLIISMQSLLLLCKLQRSSRVMFCCRFSKPTLRYREVLVFPRAVVIANTQHVLRIGLFLQHEHNDSYTEVVF